MLAFIVLFCCAVQPMHACSADNPSPSPPFQVLDYRASDGGWLRLVLSNVQGGSGINTVELRQTPLAVRGCWRVAWY